MKHSSSSPQAAAALCRSCGVGISGNYCSNCAEATIPHVPSAGEFLHEFLGHFVAFEGKLWTTLKSLTLRPGQLTADYLFGRRVPYVPPLRLYLTLSVVFFALIHYFGVALPQITIDDSTIGIGYHKSARPAEPSVIAAGKAVCDARSAAAAPAHLQAGLDCPTEPQAKPALPPKPPSAIRTAVFNVVGKISPAWEANLKLFIAESGEKKSAMLNRGFLDYLPYILIGTLPLFALYLKLAYLGSGRRYGEHLVFALHVNGFAFLLSSLMIVLPGSAVWFALAAYEGMFIIVSPWDCLQLLPFAYLLAYLPLAMRRVYGGGRGATTLRWLSVITAHLSVVIVSTVLAEALAILNQA